ncbi:hypothetical protein PPACK8108_LOCUS25343 [Phakopsora pachyrhizi]|uniref:PHD-type domain-containing protein n=1 Tax=Phakopsora pachyrhizi TaxID=170000 RepID=A0AAV0BTR0_PHAPC|nr:hypothetical protein PPACK8108_LOCUS25343 [Phakopsora pachyrhizi]
MTKSVPETEETVEVNGESYALNDHVYLSAPWNASDGAPWLIGRIMEFIRESVPTGPPKKKKTRSIIQLKLAHYHRQRDLLSRHIIDCRLLAASMTYDTFCISRLRGKCRVEFKGDRTPEEVEGWKATPNCFYFSQVYGRYTHRHYDLILTQNLKNAPPEVIQFLRTNYSYIFTEPGMGPELSEERRGCVTCQKWTSGSDSVTCDLCNGAYHFACLNPPLIRKPERGYRWACAPCSKKRQESLDDHTIALSKALSDQCGSSTVITGLTPGGGGRALRDKGKKKEAPVTTLVQSGTGSNGVLRTVDGWPFRYYGQYTQPTTVLDPMDSPYLYTAPRIGIRFQTTVLEDVSINHDSNMRSPHRAAGRPVKSEKRSRDGTPLALPMISDEESEFDNYMSQVSQLPLFKQAGVSLLDKALKNLKEKPSFDDSLAELRELSGKSLGFLNWSESESNRMDSAISQLGDDIRGMLKLFPKKTWVDLTKHYYMFKGHKFPETSALETRLSASVSHLPDENLAILPTPSSKRPYICVNPKVPALKAPVPPPVSSTLTFTPSLTTSTTPPSTTIQTNFTSLVELSPPSPPTQPQKPATPLVTFTPQIPGP